MKGKLKKQKYIGVYRCEFSATRIINPKFPSTVTIYIPRNRTEGAGDQVNLLIPTE